MKINVKDILENEDLKNGVHTNDRLDIKEIFDEVIGEERKKTSDSEIENNGAGDRQKKADRPDSIDDTGANAVRSAAAQQQAEAPAAGHEPHKPETKSTGTTSKQINAESSSAKASEPAKPETPSAENFEPAAAELATHEPATVKDMEPKLADSKKTRFADIKTTTAQHAEPEYTAAEITEHEPTLNGTEPTKDKITNNEAAKPEHSTHEAIKTETADTVEAAQPEPVVIEAETVNDDVNDETIDADTAELAEHESSESELTDPAPAADEQVEINSETTDHETTGSEPINPELADHKAAESEPVDTAPAESRFKRFKNEYLNKKYGWITGIAASIIILLGVTFIYTNMIPREVNATINGEEYTFYSTEYTVDGVLDDEGISVCSEDYISVPVSTYVYDGIDIEVKHATDFTITADGKTNEYKTLEETVEDALADAEITLGENDIVTLELDAEVTANMEIVVQRVVIKEETVEETVEYETVEKDDSSLAEGKTKVVTEGKDGTDEVTYEVTYIDGEEDSRKEISRETVTAAVDEVIANGTAIAYNGTTYSKKIVVKAYAYTGGGTTAMGTKARVGEIAVDLSAIPLGTNVYIVGVGARQAEDTGGNIKGNTIDIYMNTQSQYLSWGARYVTVYIQ